MPLVDLCYYYVNPFRTAVPFRGQTTYNLNSLFPINRTRLRS